MESQGQEREKKKKGGVVVVVVVVMMNDDDDDDDEDGSGLSRGRDQEIVPLCTKVEALSNVSGSGTGACVFFRKGIVYIAALAIYYHFVCIPISVDNILAALI